MPNRLAEETSPYLLQHADNPVDWYPWGPEALKRARDEDKPILLSIGYSACHWCHVMEHESFENDDIAAIMNEHFVNIKVDREERPDLDTIYMSAVQAMTHHGGWPMTMFLTPDGRPFYGGTYFPPSDRGQMPGFPRVLASVVAAYQTRRSDLEEQAAQIADHLSDQMPTGTGTTDLSPEVLETAAREMARHFEPRYGGFGRAPKFPQPMTMDFLLRQYQRHGREQDLQMVEHTLRHMAHGGLYDQLGGGFHRYSTDNEWLVPHFEKMLYDNAQLARLYLHAYQVTGKTLYRRITEETLDYVRREMTSGDGGFYSTQDADSEGEEGKFFLWSPDEVTTILGPGDARIFKAYYDVSRRGNFEGRNILNIRIDPDNVAHEHGLTSEALQEVLARGRQKLLAVRETRIKPGRDEKVLTSWNGLMLRAFAEASIVLDRPDYLEIGIHNARFIRNHLTRQDRLLRSYKDGKAKLNGYLEDYAFLAWGLLALHGAGGGTEWFVWAHELTEQMLARFADEQQGGFFDTSDDHEALISRPKDLMDNATPAGNSIATEVLLTLASLTGAYRYREVAERSLRALADMMGQHPTAFGELLCALDTATRDVLEVAIVGDPGEHATRTLLHTSWKDFRPGVAVAVGPSDTPGIPLLEGRPPVRGEATAYVCRNFACLRPVTEQNELLSALDGMLTA